MTPDRVISVSSATAAIVNCSTSAMIAVWMTQGLMMVRMVDRLQTVMLV